LDRLTLIFSTSIILASLAFAALPWRAMNSAEAAGYAESNEPASPAPRANVAALAICPGRAAMAANVAAADLAK
jgi:hypothetical protein